MSEEENKESSAAVTEQSEKAAESAIKKVQRIRARSSYFLFQRFYDFLKTNPDISEILKRFYEILDAKGGFGSRRNADYAKESLDWVLRDMK
jgi:hypothetical protein